MEIISSQDQQDRKKDFFINYAPQDVAWAEWIAWQLEQNQYSVIMPEWDFLPGSNIVLELNKAVSDTERTIAIFTPNYVATLRTLPDWTATYKRDVASEQRLLLPVRVVPCEAEGILSVIKPIDIVGYDVNTTTELLLTGIKKERAKSASPPKFPGAKPPILGREIECNPLFVGREHTIKVVYHTLQSTSIAVLTHSLESSKGSVGKTEIAREYIYRYQYDYSTVLWLQDNPLDSSFNLLTHSLQNILQLLHIQIKDLQDLTSLLVSLRQWLEGHQDWLLVLDGIKYINTLSEVLPDHPQGHILITTRERAIAVLAPLIELKDRTSEEMQLSDRLSKLIDATLHSSDGTQIHIGVGDTTIGSAHDNTKIISDTSVAPHHALITLREGNYFITDLQGSTGTFVEGRRLTPGIPTMLKQKDDIKIGDVLWIYASDATDITFANVHVSAGSEQSALEAAVPRIEDPFEVIKRARQDVPPEGWQVLLSEKISFLDFRQLLLHLDVTWTRGLLLFIFLIVSSVFSLFALVEDVNVNSFCFFLFALCLNILAVGCFAYTVAGTIERIPAKSLASPYEHALLVLSPIGFVEYIDPQTPVDCVSYADVALLQIHKEEDHGDWLSLLYYNGEEGQWSPRAYFKSPRYVTQQILQSFTLYTRGRYDLQRP